MKDSPELVALIKRALAATEAMSPEARAAMYAAQRESYARSEADWPKANFHWENGVKVYESYEDYCNG